MAAVGQAWWLLHPSFLKTHYFTSISRAMKGSKVNCELDDDYKDYDSEEFSKPEEGY